jgi:hypothetical protein
LEEPEELEEVGEILEMEMVMMEIRPVCHHQRMDLVLRVLLPQVNRNVLKAKNPIYSHQLVNP